MSEKSKCILAYVFGWVGGLIVLFAVKNNEKNTKFHAAQSIVLTVAYTLLATIISSLPLGIISDAVWGLYIVLMVIGIVKVNNNEEPKLPVIGDLTESIFGKIINK